MNSWVLALAVLRPLSPNIKFVISYLNHVRHITLEQAIESIKI